MEDLKNRINYVLLNDLSEADSLNFVESSIELYDFISIGGVQPRMCDNIPNFDNEEYDIISAWVRGTVYIFLSGPIDSIAGYEAFLFNRIAKLLDYISKEGESLLPEYKLIKKIAKGNKSIEAQLTLDWQERYEKSPFDAYIFLNTLTKWYALIIWKLKLLF